MTQDGVQIGDKIISFIRLRGPSLPVQIARETGLSILFASAFLSELFGEKIVKISNIRVGSSPLYFIPGQEPQLERFSQYLKSREKDAFMLLAERKILRDSEQQPAIRVALREIKDFAIPFEKNNEVFWRYFLIEEPNNIKRDVEEKVEEEIQEPIKEEIGVEEEKQEEEVQKEIPKKERAPKKIKQESKPKKANKNEKKDENFFNSIKEFLSKKKIEIIDIKDFKNDEAILKIKKGNNEELLFVFNKKTITEVEMLKANKKSSEIKLPYSILFLGEPSKKLSELISAVKNLSSISKLE